MTDLLPPWLQDLFLNWLPVLLAIAIGGGLIFAVRRVLVFQAGKTNENVGPLGQLALALLAGAAVVGVILALPIGDAEQGQLLSLLGLLTTAAIALASTTFLGNAMAGLMLRSIGNFRPGDFVRTGDQFGRVSEQGLLHTEIQTEDSDLTTIPNLQLVTSPVTVIRASGTIVSATTSLGYDIPHGDIEQCLLQAAEDAGLEQPFVQILELGDMAVTYRVAGTLTEVSRLLSTKSNLRSAMLDRLHGADIEIVSPTHMIQRKAGEGERSIPVKKEMPIAADTTAAAPEDKIFDKAEEAEAVTKLGDELAQYEEEIRALGDQLKSADDNARPNLEQALQRAQSKADQLKSALVRAESKVKGAD